MKNSQKILVVLFVGFILVSVCREVGMINLNWTKSTFADRKTANLTAKFRTTEADGRITDTSKTKTNSFITTVNATDYSFGFFTSPQTNPITGFATVLNNVPDKAPTIKTKAKSAELMGIYWTPFYKTGTCVYVFETRVERQDGRVYVGIIDGTLDFSILGISSISNTRAKVAEKIKELTIAHAKTTVKELAGGQEHD